MITPLQIKGSETSVRICDANGRTLATINKSLGEKDYETAKQIVDAVNRDAKESEA
jgi:hypothetical protein